jgi:hypothetical protein
MKGMAGSGTSRPSGVTATIAEMPVEGEEEDDVEEGEEEEEEGC